MNKDYLPPFVSYIMKSRSSVAVRHHYGLFMASILALKNDFELHFSNDKMMVQQTKVNCIKKFLLTYSTDI